MKKLLIFVIIAVGAYYAFNYLSGHRLTQIGSKLLDIYSPVFVNNGKLPVKYTCDGDGINPPLQFTGIPTDTQSLALLVDDSDAPDGTFNHWFVYNIPANTAFVSEGQAPGDVGKNSNGDQKYEPPCPPPGSIHHYHFIVYALNILSSDPIVNKQQFLSTMASHVVDQAEIVGEYERTK